MRQQYGESLQGKLLNVVHDISADQQMYIGAVSLPLDISLWADERYNTPLLISIKSLKPIGLLGEFTLMRACLTLDEGDYIMDVIHSEVPKFSDDDLIAQDFFARFDEAFQTHNHNMCKDAQEARMLAAQDTQLERSTVPRSIASRVDISALSA
jgi:hypothetical protein